MAETNNQIQLAKPQDRLTHYGIKGLTDKELLRNLLSPFALGKKKEDDLIKNIIKSLDRNEAIKFETLTKIPCMTEQMAKLLISSLEIGRRWPARKARQILTPSDAYNEVRHFATRPQEHLIVMALNGAHEIIFTEVVSVGIVNMTYANPREIFSNAVMSRATGIIVAHNHPSGVLVVTSEDATVTKRIITCGRMLGISVLDHLIISEHGYLSMKSKGIIP